VVFVILANIHTVQGGYEKIQRGLTSLVPYVSRGHDLQEPHARGCCYRRHFSGREGKVNDYGIYRVATQIPICSVDAAFGC